MTLRINLVSLFALLAVFMQGQQSAPANVDSLQKKVDHLEQDVTKMKKLLVTGWIQSQFQYIETRGAANFDGGTFSPNSDKRFMIRRGRVNSPTKARTASMLCSLMGQKEDLT